MQQPQDCLSKSCISVTNESRDKIRQDVEHFRLTPSINLQPHSPHPQSKSIKRMLNERQVISSTVLDKDENIKENQLKTVKDTVKIDNNNCFNGENTFGG